MIIMTGVLFSRIRKNSLLWCMALAAVQLSCTDKLKTDDDETPAKTILVYMAADNNLSNYVEPNLKAMKQSLYAENCSHCNILALIDRPNKQSVLLNIHDGVEETVREFGSNLKSSDSETLKMAIDCMLDMFPNREYGLLLWSHGSGWVPTSMLGQLAYNLGYRSGKMMLKAAKTLQVSPLTRSFSIEDASQYPYYSGMEIKDLANAIPDHCFDFIMCDACYMGCVEVAYELKDKTRYFISSSTEIMANGFPYYSITAKLAKGQLIGVCRDFYSYYNAMDGFNRLAAVSLVRTEGLDSLAACFGKIVSTIPDNLDRTDFSDVQELDRFEDMKGNDRTVSFDLKSVVRKLASDNLQIAEFNSQLERCVLFSASTPELFVGCPEKITVTEFSGLSVYIPFDEFDSNGLNNMYSDLKWSKATNYK